MLVAIVERAGFWNMLQKNISMGFWGQGATWPISPGGTGPAGKILRGAPGWMPRVELVPPPKYRYDMTFKTGFNDSREFFWQKI